MSARELPLLRRVPGLWKVESLLSWHYLCRFMPLDIWLQATPLQRPFGDFRFGETPWCTGHELLDWAGVGPEDVFYDLGCGRGKLVFLAALERGCRAVGVELLPGYVRIARSISRQLGLSRVEVRRSDFGDVDCAQASVVFVAGTIFEPATRELLATLVDQLSAGSRWISVSWPTEHPDLEVLEQREMLFSWGREMVYLHRVRDPSARPAE